MNVLGFELTRDASSHLFADVTIDGQRLLPKLNRITATTHDVVTMLLPQRPDLAVEWIHGLVQPSTYDDEHLSRNEVPLYSCPIDYDLLCGGFAMTVTLMPQTARWSNFRYISTAEDAVEQYTALLAPIAFEFQRTEYEMTLIQLQEKYR